MAEQKRRARPRRRRIGVWLVGARGGLATTVMTGTFAVARGLAEPVGLLTETPLFEGFPLAGFGDLVFGGHDIREITTLAAAQEVGRDSGAIGPELCRPPCKLNRPFS